MLLRAVLVAALALILPGAVLLPVWQHAGVCAGEDDALYYFPSRVLLHETFRSGQWPWLNPWTGLGRPLLADPQSAVFYPPTWLLATLDPLAAYPLTLWLHYSLAFVGMYRLLRAQHRGSAGGPASVGGPASGWSQASDAIAPSDRSLTVAARLEDARANGDDILHPLPDGRGSDQKERGSDRSGRDSISQSRLGLTACLFGAIAFTFCGFMLAHRAHFTMICAAAWTPWVFWRLERYVRAGGVLRFVAAAIPAALQCHAGHVQIAALTALGTLIYCVVRRNNDECRVTYDDGGTDARAHCSQSSGTGHADELRISNCEERIEKGRARAWNSFFAIRNSELLSAARWLLVWLAAAALFAVQAIPTLEYAWICTRAERGYLDFTENSWLPISALTWVLPMLLGQRTPNFFDVEWWAPSHQCEQFAYAGALPLLLAVFALRPGWRGDPLRRPWVLLAVLGLLLALGRYGPVAPLLYWVPGASLLRVPARAMLLWHLCVAVLAARTLDELARRASPDHARLRYLLQTRLRRPVRLALLIVGVPTALVASAALLAPAELRASMLAAATPWKPTIWVPLLVWLASLAALAFVAARGASPMRRLLLLPLLALDLAIIGWTLDVPSGRADPRAALWPEARTVWMRDVADSGQRLWVVNERGRRLPGEYTDPLAKGVANVNILDGVESLTDYGPFQPRGFDRAFGFKPWGEAPHAASMLADPAWMQWYDVGWVLLSGDGLPAPPHCDLVVITPRGDRLYRFQPTRGRAYLLNAATPASITHTAETPYRLRTRIDTYPADSGGGERRLVVAQLALPGWHATIDGQPAEILALDDVLLSVRLPERTPVEVVWTYSPPGLTAGAVVTLAALGVIAVLLAASAWNRRAPFRE